MHETFDHTADLGLRAFAPDLNALFAELGKALFAAILENPEEIRAVDSEVFTLEADNLEDLLFDYLRGLLYRFDAEQKVIGVFEVEVVGLSLKATLSGEPWNPERHIPLHEVKAITWHDFKLKMTPDGFLAEVIVDI